MADLTLVGTQAGQDTSLSSTTISATVPTGTANGNGQRIWYSSAVLTGGGAPTHTTPAGWTAAGTTTYTGLGGLDGRVTCYVKIAGSSESAVTLTSSANAAHQYHYSTYSNPDTGAFLNASAVFTTVASGTSHAIPSITTTAARVLLDQVLFATSSSITWTPPGGTTERVDANSTALGDEIQAVAGASGTRTWTASASTASVIGQVALAGNVVTITAQPTDQTVNNGATATFSVTASGGVAPLSYQWQDNSSGSFANISGATSSSYAPTAAYSMQGRQYRCIVTDATAQATTSSSATLRVAFNLTGTGPRAYPTPGGLIGAGTVDAWLRGTASAGSSFEHVASGGFSFSGAATALQSSNFTFSASGGLTLAGAATAAEANDYSATASGGFTFGGTAGAVLDVGYTFNGSGGITLGGTASAAEANDYTHTPSGGITLSGAATTLEANDYVAAGSGGIVLGGTAGATLDVGFSVTASGGITFSGAATVAESNDYAVTSSGGFLFGGSAATEGPAAPSGGGDIGRDFWIRRRGR